MKKNKMMKRLVMGIVTAVILLSGVIVSPKEANEAEAVALSEDKVCYDDKTGSEFKNFYLTQEKTAPTKAGYLFGGWYKDQGATPITAETAESVGDNDTVYAKFVPAYVLSVKSQNYASTAESTNKTNKTTTRVVSTVDESLLYSEVGFKGLVNGKEFKVNTTKVWEKLAVGTGTNRTEYEATNIFGKVSKYFFVLNINDIPETKWGDQIYVRPYWITEDGTEVEGLGKYVYVEDGLKGYISVPVNLNNVTAGIGAGVIEVDYDETKLEYVECVAGRVFEEMNAADKVAADGNKYVRCVGNVETLADVTEDDMYITLRFEVIENKTLTSRTAPYQFIVSEEDFTNVDETKVTLKVWDVQY